MNNLLWLFIPGLLAIGSAASYTDIKKGKIRNWTVAAGIGYAVAVNLLLILFFKQRIGEGHLADTGINIFSALLLGFVMWYVGIWTAGDSKLFLAFAALVPAFSYQSHSMIPYLNPLNILINTFFPVFIFYFFKLMLQSTWKEKKDSISLIFSPKVLAGLALSLFVFMWIEKIFIFIFQERANVFLQLFIILVLLIFLEKILSKKIIYVLSGAAFLRLLFDQSIYSLGFVKLFAVYYAVFLFFRLFLINLSYFRFTKEVKVGDLKKGMIPAETIGKDSKKRKVLYFSFFDYLRPKKEEGIYEISPEGLENRDISEIKKLSKKGNLEKVRIQETIPFAPFLFFGALATVTAGGNILIPVSYYMIIFLNKAAVWLI